MGGIGKAHSHCLPQLPDRTNNKKNHTHTNAYTHLVHGDSASSRCNSCFEPHLSESPERVDAWSALHTDGHYNCDIVQLPPYKSFHQSWGKKRGMWPGYGLEGKDK